MLKMNLPATTNQNGNLPMVPERKDVMVVEGQAGQSSSAPVVSPLDPSAVDFDELLQAARESFADLEKQQADIQAAFADGIDKELANLEANEAQKAMLKTSILMYLQARIDNHLQDIFPDEFFARLDDMLDKKEISDEESFGFILAAYGGATGSSLFDYSQRLLATILPEFLDIFKRGEATLAKVAAADESTRGKFSKLLSEGRFDEVDALIENL